MEKNLLKKGFSFIIVFTIMFSATGASFAKADTKNTFSENDSNLSDSKDLSIEVLEGTNDNWKKLKITFQDGEVQIIEREVINDKIIDKIYSQSYELLSQLIVDDGVISIDGKVIGNVPSEINETSSTPTMGTFANANDGSGFYLISKINSSLQADFTVKAACISYLSAIFSIPASLLTTTALTIMGAKVKTLWYTERKYSDKKAYQPKYKKYITFYYDSKRTKIQSVSNIIYQ